MEQKLEKRVLKLEKVLTHLIYLIQANPIFNQYSSEHLLKMLHEKEVDDEVRDKPEVGKGSNG